MEIPEKWTQGPPCFAITIGVRLRSHTNKTERSNYGDVTWASKRLKSPKNPLFVQQLVQADIKGNIQARMTCPLWGESDSNAESVSMSWRHHAIMWRDCQIDLGDDLLREMNIVWKRHLQKARWDYYVVLCTVQWPFLYLIGGCRESTPILFQFHKQQNNTQSYDSDKNYWLPWTISHCCHKYFILTLRSDLHRLTTLLVLWQFSYVAAECTAAS